MKNDEREDQNIRERYGSALRQMMNLDASRCPAPDRLIDWREGRLSGTERSAVEDHVCGCLLCMAALEALRIQGETAGDADKASDRWPAIEKTLDAQFKAALAGSTVPNQADCRVSDRPVVRKNRAHQFVRRILSRRPRYGIPALTGGFAAFALATVYAIAFLGRDPTFSLGRVQPDKPPILRSRSAPSAFMHGLRKYKQGKYRQAASDFETDLRIRPGQYRTLYYLGLSRLAGAERGLPGMPFRFDATEARRGSEALGKALAAAGGNAYYRADCLWYLGKAALMTGDLKTAKEKLEELKKMKLPDSSRPPDAERLLSALESPKIRKD
jgi:hypothetical protein